MVTRFPKHSVEKGLRGLFEPLRKPVGRNDDPGDGSGGIPIVDRDLDDPSMPPVEPDPPWLV